MGNTFKDKKPPTKSTLFRTLNQIIGSGNKNNPVMISIQKEVTKRLLIKCLLQGSNVGIQRAIDTFGKSHCKEVLDSMLRDPGDVLDQVSLDMYGMPYDELQLRIRDNPEFKIFLDKVHLATMNVIECAKKTIREL